MIEVVLPDRGPVASLSDDIVLAIVQRIHHTSNYVVSSEARRIGRYVKVKNTDDGSIHYVCLSNPDNDSRNARLMQFVSPAYIEFKKDPNNNKTFDIYIIRPDRNDRTDYAKLFYRCFVTIGINILNTDELQLTDIHPFNSYEDLKAYRNKTSDRNSHNRQTFFVDESDEYANQISIYGKTFGANAMESFIFAITLARISSKIVVFYQVLDNDSTALSDDQRKVLEEEGVDFGEKIELLPGGRTASSSTRDTSRDTPVFHYNLLKKYGDKRCYICGCDMEHMIIGSHIERVTDIDHNIHYDDAEKNRRATDGDNGFWLCANHDKMFEYGIIYFSDSTLQIGRLSNEPTDRPYIDHSFKTIGNVYSEDLTSVGEIRGGHFHIKHEHYNENMRDYLEKHKRRVTSANILL